MALNERKRLLNMDLYSLRFEIRKSSNIRKILLDDKFWKEKFELEYGTISHSGNWRSLYESYYNFFEADKELEKILDKLWNDITSKRDSIIERYSRYLDRDNRIPRGCYGKYEKLHYIIKEEVTLEESEQQKEIEEQSLPNKWLLLTSSEGEKVRKIYINNDFGIAFRHYNKLTASSYKEEDYYGVMFIGVHRIGENYIYGNPSSTEERIYFQHKDRMPKDILDYFINLSKKESFIKIYFFMSNIDRKQFAWVISGEEEEKGFRVNEKDMRDFIISVVSDGTIFPIIMHTRSNSCRNRECGPWFEPIFLE